MVRAEEPLPRAGAVALPAFLSAFGFRNFRLLWTGAFLSSIGTWTQDVALAWLIHTRLGDPFYLGLRAFAADAPLLAFMLVGGAVADRVDRRRILLVVERRSRWRWPPPWASSTPPATSASRPSSSSPFLTGLTQSQSAPTYQAVHHEPGAAAADPERGGPELAPVQPLARHRARDRRPPPGPRGHRRLLRRERASASWP